VNLIIEFAIQVIAALGSLAFIVYAVVQAVGFERKWISKRRVDREIAKMEEEFQDG